MRKMRAYESLSEAAFQLRPSPQQLPRRIRADHVSATLVLTALALLGFFSEAPQQLHDH
jgi:hypothetical protein